jgi:hypothetical protein
MANNCYVVEERESCGEGRKKENMHDCRDAAASCLLAPVDIRNNLRNR